MVMTRQDLLQWSFVSLLVGGVLIIAGGVMGGVLMGGYGMGMVGNAPVGGFGPFFGWLTAWAFVTGAVVLVAAFRVRIHPAEAGTWGVAAIVAGALSFLGMGGFFIGAAAAIAGGVMALFRLSDAGCAAEAAGMTSINQASILCRYPGFGPRTSEDSCWVY